MVYGESSMQNEDANELLRIYGYRDLYANDLLNLLTKVDPLIELINLNTDKIENYGYYEVSENYSYDKVQKITSKYIKLPLNYHEFRAHPDFTHNLLSEINLSSMSFENERNPFQEKVDEWSDYNNYNKLEKNCSDLAVKLSNTINAKNKSIVKFGKKYKNMEKDILTLQKEKINADRKLIPIKYLMDLAIQYDKVSPDYKNMIYLYFCNVEKLIEINNQIKELSLIAKSCLDRVHSNNIYDFYLDYVLDRRQLDRYFSIKDSLYTTFNSLGIELDEKDKQKQYKLG